MYMNFLFTAVSIAEISLFLMRYSLAKSSLLKCFPNDCSRFMGTYLDRLFIATSIIYYGNPCFLRCLDITARLHLHEPLHRIKRSTRRK